jgi:hypothetical protein
MPKVSARAAAAATEVKRTRFGFVFLAVAFDVFVQFRNFDFGVLV